MVDLDTTCRTCMKKNENLINLFDSIKLEENYNMLLAEALALITSCQVMRNDGMPQNICSQCVNILKVVMTFRANSLKAEENLRKIIFFTSSLKEEIKDEDQTDEESSLVEKSYDTIEIYPINSLHTKIKRVCHNDIYECDKCEKYCTNRETLLNHVQTPGKDSRNKHVLELDKDFSDSKDNILSETDFDVKPEVRRYKCHECHQSFSRERSLITHRRKHKNYSIKKGDNLKFECDICGKEFSKKPLLKRHLKLHSMSRPFVCKSCMKSYTRLDQLKRHAKSHDKVKSHVCSYCNKEFVQLCTLKDHLRVHTKEVPYLCSLCGKSFNNSSNLRQHMTRHTGVKPFSCTVCPKTFCTKGQMVNHLSTHTDAHPHKCDECGAAFTKPNSLKKHKFIHLDVKAFACQTCGKRFNRKDQLKRHYRTHTGEKPYPCKYCDRAFTQSNDAIKHMRTHVGQNTYHCTVCNMKFRLMRDLKKHYPTHYVKGTKAPVVAIGNGMVAPILVASEDSDAVPNEMIIVNEGIKIIVNK